ncbi:MAG: branched-chain amino acid ABC transporter permease, partial [Chloroflexota bacterium]
MSLTEFIEAILRGASSGSIYALIALGYNVIFATTNILNF